LSTSSSVRLVGGRSGTSKTLVNITKVGQD